MFDHLKKKTSKASKSKANTAEMPRTIAFLGKLVEAKIRLTYSALANAAEELGEHTATNMSVGQRGSAICKTLPLELQPHICNAKGRYAKGTTWETDVPGDLNVRDFVGPDDVSGYVQAFVAATSEKITEEITEESDSEEIEAEIAELDEIQDEDNVPFDINPEA